MMPWRTGYQCGFPRLRYRPQFDGAGEEVVNSPLISMRGFSAAIA